jgi:hypothetical protein
VSNGLLGGGIDTTASSSQDSDENARDSLATTSFVANGLLGVAVTGDAAIAVHAKSLDSQGYADVSVSNSGFVTNGLLGGPSIVDSHVGVQKSDFVTNGLLGTTLDECIADASSSKDDMGASFEASMTDTSSTFVSNGLLGSMESTLVASTIGAPASTEDFRSQGASSDVIVIQISNVVPTVAQKRTCRAYRSFYIGMALGTVLRPQERTQLPQRTTKGSPFC